MNDMPTHRMNIKRTVERVIPQMDIDTTKVLTDEEITELKRQTEARSRDAKMAAEVGREGLKSRLNKTIALFKAPDSKS